MRLETIQNLQAAGWNLPDFDESKKGRQADTFRRNREEDVTNATSSAWGYGVSSLAVIGATVVLAPAALITTGCVVIAGGLGLFAASKKQAATRITSATKRYLAAEEHIHYLSSFNTEITSQLKLLDKKAPNDKQRNIAKIHALWTKLDPFIIELKNTRNVPLIQAFLAQKIELVSELSALKEQFKKKVITKAEFNQLGTSKIKEIFANFMDKDGLIQKLIDERRMFMGILYNEFVDNIEFVK